MDNILIVMTSGPDTPRRCATPFFFATLGAAMDYDVTMFFTIDGTALLKRGAAETVVPKEGGEPVSKFLQDAQEAGVRFVCCSSSLELNDMVPGDLIAGVEVVGGASMWDMAENAKVMTF